MQAGGVPVTGDDSYVDPRWGYPEYEAGSVVELRIHGVGGAGPEAATRDPHPVQVGGSDQVGFWRARNPHVPGSEGHVREVVSWGGSTSGAKQSALWVLLLPFGLFNAAGRMHPASADGGPSRRRDVHQAVCRMLALTITLSSVAIVCATVLDLYAVQCGAIEACRDADLTGRWLLSPLRWGANDAAALFAALTLLPMLVPYVQRHIGRRSLGHDPMAEPEGDAPRTPTQRLDEPWFWFNLWPAWRLRSLHISAGYAFCGVVLAGALRTTGLSSWLLDTAPIVLVATLAATIVGAGLPRTASPARLDGLAGWTVLLRFLSLGTTGLLVGAGMTHQLDQSTQLVAVVGAALVVLWGWYAWIEINPRGADSSGAGPSGTWRDLALFVGSGLLAAGLGLTGLSAPAMPVDDLIGSDALMPTNEVLAGIVGELPGFVHGPIWVLAAVQVALLLALVGSSVSRIRSGRDGRGPIANTAIPFNLGAPVLALMSMLLITAAGAGIHGFVLDWLGRRVPTIWTTPMDVTAEITTVAPREAIGLAMPWWYVQTAEVVAIVVVALLVGAGVVLLAVRGMGLGSPRDITWEEGGNHVLPTPDDLDPHATTPPDEDLVVLRAINRGLERLPRLERLGRNRRSALVGLARKARGAWTHQGVIRRSGTLLFGAVLGATVVGSGLFTWRLASLPEDQTIADLSGAYDDPWITVALAMVVAIPPVAVAIVRTARSDRAARRQIAALWDVLAFWPRTTHPFAPPSYGEALVPGLVERCNALDTEAVLAPTGGEAPRGTREPDPAQPPTPVLLTGHSQGSVVALATSVHPRLRKRPLHLVTYGSPIAMLYEGLFPAVFGGRSGVIACATAAAEGRGDHGPDSWHNVLSMSEPLGTVIWDHSLPAGMADGTTPMTASGPTDGDAGARTAWADRARRTAWPLLLELPWAECPLCAWSAGTAGAAAAEAAADGQDPTAAATDATGRAAGAGTEPQGVTDITVTDPDRPLSPTGEVDGVVLGHSCYHRSRELDLHLAHLAAAVRGAHLARGGGDGASATAGTGPVVTLDLGAPTATQPPPDA